MKIDISFKSIITKAPGESYNVLIVTKKGTGNSLPGDVHAVKRMEDIFSATISGNKIMELIKSDKVLSIEEDKEMGIM
ncbi:MAG: hypothetical protein WCL00_10170 [Bacteroidota bacterium]